MHTTTDLGYRAPLVCRLARVTYRQLDYWDRSSLVGPSVQTARGSGSQRLYAFADVLLVLMISRLLDAGMSLRTIRRTVDTIKPLVDDEEYGAFIFITDGGYKVEVARTATEVVKLIKNGYGAFIFSVEALANELTAAIPIEIERVRSFNRSRWAS